MPAIEINVGASCSGGNGATISPCRPELTSLHVFGVRVLASTRLRLPWASRRRAALESAMRSVHLPNNLQGPQKIIVRHRLNPSGFDMPSLANAKCACHLRRSN